MTIEIMWDVSITPTPTGAAVHEWFDAHLRMLNPQGTRGYTVRLGPDDADEVDAMPLRIDVDPDAGRAAVRWLPEHLLAAALPPADQPLRVSEWTDYDGLIEIPGQLARVDVATAVALAAAYVDSGERPAGVEWVPMPTAEELVPPQPVREDFGGSF